jgi:NTE family protein
MVKTNMKTVSLVLGSGGARGLAHIGVIHWLEENNYNIRSIAGSSIGALIGGIYAAGKLDEYEQWVRAIKKIDIVTLLDLSWGKSGLVKGDKIINTLVGLVGEQLIEDLPIHYTAVATDLKNQKEIWMKSGKLFDAIRASMSIPLFFTPFKDRGVDLVDGGILNPVPVAPTIGDRTDMTIAVNLGGSAESVGQIAQAGIGGDTILPFRHLRLCRTPSHVKSLLLIHQTSL